LASAEVIAFVPTCDPAEARRFYGEVIGLELVSEDSFALEFRAHGASIRVANVSSTPGFQPAPYTILGWEVASVADAARALAARGVVFERYPGMEQDELGVWTSPNGARIAWFKDPDGNLLSIREMTR
ncbi:MAG TPA: VOC family protein, partial [Longimicrobiaceae bacterium]|nr:VOC family protein [Longimicrobiaceae bacterium]